MHPATNPHDTEDYQGSLFVQTEAPFQAKREEIEQANIVSSNCATCGELLPLVAARTYIKYCNKECRKARYRKAGFKKGQKRLL